MIFSYLTLSLFLSFSLISSSSSSSSSSFSSSSSSNSINNLQSIIYNTFQQYQILHNNTFTSPSSSSSSLKSESNNNLRRLQPGPKTGPSTSIIDPCTKLIANQLGWENWEEIITSKAAVFRPKDDKQLSDILKAAKKNNCIVRVTGATGSHDGIVTQRREENIIIVSLADHKTQNKNWVDKVFKTTSTVRIGAGRTFYNLTQLIRPQGYLLKSRMAGRYFTIGGVVANMVHGAGNNHGFIHEDVTGLLVMLANGNIVEVTNEDDLKYWRNSAGLLGIILAVEFSLLQDTGFEMILDVKSYDLTSNSFFNTFVTDVFTAVALNDHTEFFFNPYDGELLILRSDMHGTPPDSTKLNNYKTASANLVNQNANNDISFNGAPKVPITSACDLIPQPYCLDSQASAYIIVGAMHDVVQSDWNTASSTVNDGFYSTSVAKFHSLDTFAPAGTFPQMVGQFLGLFQAFAQSGSSIYYPTGGLQFRFVNPTSKQGILSPIPPIDDVKAAFLAQNFFPLPSATGAPNGYVALHYTGLTNINDEYSDIFLQQLESLYKNTPIDPTSAVGPTNPLIPIKSIHLGKEWGYGFPPAVGLKHTYYPFSDSNLLADAYTYGKTTALADFNAKRLSLDPDGLFAGGAMMRWLDPTNHPLSYFEPRYLLDESCYDTNVLYEDVSCISSCCSSTSFKCITSQLPSNSVCTDSCQCASNNCQTVTPSGKPSPKTKPGPTVMKCA